MQIGDKAYKDVRPLSIELIEDTQEFSTGYLLWRKEWSEKTGYWYIKFVYDRGPMSGRMMDRIYFEKESVARSWFTAVYNQCFLSQDIGQQKPSTIPPPPPDKPKTPKKNNRLRLV